MTLENILGSKARTDVETDEIYTDTLPPSLKRRIEVRTRNKYLIIGSGSTILTFAAMYGAYKIYNTVTGGSVTP
jgi:hypothetical protein